MPGLETIKEPQNPNGEVVVLPCPGWVSQQRHEDMLSASWTSHPGPQDHRDRRCVQQEHDV